MAFDFISIGKRLKEARIKQHLTQQQLAELLGTSVSYVKVTERGQRPSLEYLQTVVENCHVSYNWLLTGSEILINNQKKAIPLVPASNLPASSHEHSESNNIITKPEEIRKILALLKENENEIKQWLGEQIRLYLKEQEAGKNESQSDK